MGPPGGSVNSPIEETARRLPRQAAQDVGCDFPVCGHTPPLGQHHGRQDVGGSSIEAYKIAGQSTVRKTEEYTKIQLTRQEELTRLIQERLASVGDRQPAVVQ